MATCKDCYNNCGDTKTTDKCVKTTLPDDKDFGYCEGDPLFDLEKILIEKIKSALNGSGIVLNSVSLDNCAFLKAAFIGKEKKVADLFQLLIDSFCALKETVDSLKPKSVSFDTKCLTGLSASSTPNDILQALLIAFCNLQTVVEKFPGTYLKLTDVEQVVKQVIVKMESEVQPVPTAPTEYKTLLIPKVAYEYYGDLSNFSASGVGLAANGFDKIYLCNGANGTPDKRGRVAVGAIRNIPGGTMDASVDPNNPINPNTNYAVGEKGGKNFVNLGANDLPPFSFTVAGSTSSINIIGQKGGDNSDHSNTAAFAFGDKTAGETGFNQTKSFSVTTESQTINIPSSNLAHENRQPFIAAAYIMYIP